MQLAFAFTFCALISDKEPCKIPKSSTFILAYFASRISTLVKPPYAFKYSRLYSLSCYTIKVHSW